MKKIISLILALTMLFSISVTAFAIDFSDFTQAHWAYEYVSVLVNDGTINGFQDGTFRPEETVTRAQFVKMIGNGPTTRTETFDDVNKNHWAYNYIITSGLDALYDNMFMPDTPITRGDVATLLWKRAGSPKGIDTPPIIHRQSNNFDAVSWVYTNGIMVGDDYMDLRLGDTLTRGEASALIVRSRNISANTTKTIFYNSVDHKIFETAYNAFSLVDRPYDENATITNGELAMAAARLICGQTAPTYKNVSAEKKFEHIYAQPINMLCRYYLGAENDNAAYADKNATVKDSIAAFMFAALKSSGVYIPRTSDTMYPEIKSETNAEKAKLLKAAYQNGIWFASADSINPDKDITMKELACLALEFNGFSGFYRMSSIGAKATTTKNVKIRTNLSAYPLNSQDYRIIAAGVPNYVYEAPFANAVSKPSESYEITNAFRTIFESMLSTWISALSKVGYELEASYYPGISADNGNGYSLRVALNFKNIPSNTKLGDIINCVNPSDGEKLVNSGDLLYVDIDTGTKLVDVKIGIDKMVLSKIIG